MEVLVQWVLMLLAILGLVQLGEMICLWSRRPKKRPASFSVLPVSGRLNDPQTVLDYFEQVAAWSPESCLAFLIQMANLESLRTAIKLYEIALEYARISKEAVTLKMLKDTQKQLFGRMY